MKIQLHTSDAVDLTIPLPNALLFSSSLWNGLLKVTNHSEWDIPEVSSQVTKQACRVLKEYVQQAGSFELVHVETADGTTVIITV